MLTYRFFIKKKQKNPNFNIFMNKKRGEPPKKKNHCISLQVDSQRRRPRPHSFRIIIISHVHVYTYDNGRRVHVVVNEVLWQVRVREIC